MNHKKKYRIRRGGGVWLKMAVWLSLMCSLLAGSRAFGVEGTFTESRVKALFLIKFARYVEWPASAFPDTNAPITIGIVGSNHVGDELANVVGGKTVNGRAFFIKRLPADADLNGCQILFVGDAEAANVDKILARAAALPILTVGEDRQFAQSHGMIDFVLKAESVHLEIDLTTANQAGLKISSKLLSVADAVRGK